jgi:hypothetical protein
MTPDIPSNTPRGFHPHCASSRTACVLLPGNSVPIWTLLAVAASPVPNSVQRNRPNPRTRMPVAPSKRRCVRGSNRTTSFSGTRSFSFFVPFINQICPSCSLFNSLSLWFLFTFELFEVPRHRGLHGTLLEEGLFFLCHFSTPCFFLPGSIQVSFCEKGVDVRFHDVCDRPCLRATIHTYQISPIPKAHPLIRHWFYGNPHP